MEQIFKGDTGFDRLAFARNWMVQGKSINIFDYQGHPLFLLSEVAAAVFRGCPSNRVNGLYDAVFGCRVKLSDVEAAKKVHCKLSYNSWFVTEEGVNKVLGYETTAKRSMAAVNEIRKMLKTLHPWQVKPTKEPSPRKQEPSRKVVSIPTKNNALQRHRKMLDDLCTLRTAIVRLSVSSRAMEVLLQEFEEAFDSYRESREALGSMGLEEAACISKG